LKQLTAICNYIAACANIKTGTFAIHFHLSGIGSKLINIKEFQLRQLTNNFNFDITQTASTKFAVQKRRCTMLLEETIMHKEVHKWRPRYAPADEEWQVDHQIVVPNKYWEEFS